MQSAKQYTVWESVALTAQLLQVISSGLNIMSDLRLTLTNLYFRRLKIHVVTNGLTFLEDVRDRIKWAKEMYKRREITVMEELPDHEAIEKMKHIMDVEGVPIHEQKQLFKDITGKDIL